VRLPRKPSRPLIAIPERPLQSCLASLITVDPSLSVNDSGMFRYEDHEDIAALVRHGWRLHNPYAAAGDPHSYQEFIQRSRAEFSVAKRGYVRTRSGWVSDRTACYLASGKPAVVQSTGFEGALPVGEGLLTFTELEGAAKAIAAVEDDYESHAHAARRLAEEYFDSDKVLGALLDRIGV
jgi:hypothetical protein